MPHLKGEKDESTSEKQDSHDDALEHGETATTSSKFNEGPEMLLSFATTITKHAPVDRLHLPQAEYKDQSYVTPFSCDQRPSKLYERSTNDDSSPEPEGANAISVFGTGARQLFPSPIRCTKEQNSDDDVDESDEGKAWQNMQSPAKSGGNHSDSRAGGYMYPHFGVHSYHGYPPPPPYMYHDAYSRNRQVYHTSYSPLPKPPPPPADPSSPCRKRLKRSNEENREDDDEDSDSEKEQNGLHSPASSSMGEAASKQRVISPSSSIEGGPSRNLKSQDDESTTEVNGKTSKSKSKKQSQSSQHSSLGYAQYPQPDASYSNAHSSYQQYYAPRTANYGYSYPHPFSKSHTPNCDWRMPPHASFPPPHVHAPYFSHPAHFPYGPTAPYQQYHYSPPQPPPPTPPNALSQNKAVQNSEKSDSTTKSPPSSTTEIKSVAEWQRAALTTGKAPSTNRCLPLKGPIPSKFWGESDKARESLIPEFHQLVNYPDYLTKVRLNGTEVPNPTFSETGRRPCVMCGKLRICSASCAQGIVTAPRRTKVQSEEGDDEEEQDSTHIIPRQNKGLCTVCDVTVWVIADSGLEIKWCKGCKNFRPWAAFGDKGLATKCVRCRERQREKYAIQKDELRRRRLQQNQQVDFDGDSMDALSQQQEIDAAKGLRDLLSASATI
jgi:hypothetical protein